MIKSMTNIDNYRGFINLIFGVLLILVGYFIDKKLNDINTALTVLQKIMQQQLIVNEKISGRLENFEFRIKVLEKK